MGEFLTSNGGEQHVSPGFSSVDKCGGFFSSRNRVTGVYEVSLCNLADAGSPGESPH